MKGLLDGSLGAEGEAGVDLGGNLAGDNGENLASKLDEETVEGVLDLGVEVATLVLAVLDGGVDELGVLGLLGGGEDQRGVGGGILGLVLGDGCVFGENLLVYLCCLVVLREGGWVGARR